MNHEVAIDVWRVSLPFTSKPEPISKDSVEELNRLSVTQPDNELSLKPKDWILYYTEFKLPANIAENGGSLCFKNMTGKGDIFLNGKLALERKNPTPADAVVRLERGLDTIEINARMQPDNNGHISLGDIIYITPERPKKTSEK